MGNINFFVQNSEASANIFLMTKTNNPAYNYMSLFMRKPVFGICDQVRLEPVCSATS